MMYEDPILLVEQVEACIAKFCAANPTGPKVLYLGYRQREAFHRITVFHKHINTGYDCNGRSRLMKLEIYFVDAANYLACGHGGCDL